ncbi:MAG TPA: glycoside hydrolase family 99-like domain-containing protein [Dyella sp.]|uniref:glycoside hydrolase family 99-like domain-containing protein n=1 Tax=Dyella sp. TaxID=1869338 RepID=UPI002BF25FC6|nr:glycoside hydrolase family 99-like domain-containing protein [Dyella sp.]HUB88330.1 glycoside hydrolase family 99-like domain-containing protein [Dyella sp.]
MPLPAFAKTTLFHLLRTGFRLLPLPTAVRDRMRQRFLDRHSELVPAGPRGHVALAIQPEQRPRVIAGGPAIGYRHRQPGDLPNPMPATLVAFYLPQFHPIAENDTWWGAGFTEWKNVARALPQFEGHAQPRIPGELGFYDLRVADVMRQQMQLAREYGIGAFCSYFYWFGGKTLLELPLQQWLNDPTMDLPICLCWANENWSRRWDGRADEILIGQQHSAEDDIAFIAHVARYLADPRYLRVDGKPMLLVYRPGLLPDPKATTERWRDWCRQHGLGEIHLAYVQSFDRVDPREIGFDAAVAFPPNNTTLKPITGRQRLLNPEFRGDVYDWRELVRAISEQPDPDYPLFPCVNPGWDNEPRRSGNGRVFAHASPHAYGNWLWRAIAAARRRTPHFPLVFINAWNEWAEGAILEPDSRLGFAWLEATRTALRKSAEALPTPPTRPCAIIHAWYLEVLEEMVLALRDSGIDWRIIFTTPPTHEQALRNCLRHLGVPEEVYVFENRGRDMLPFLQVADQLLEEGVDVVLKLHTKRSTHRRDGDQWRRELIDKLASPHSAKRILTAFQSNPRLGLVAAEGHLQPLDYYWGANEANVRYLISRLGIAAPSLEVDRFIAGSMFWARLDALRPILDAHLGLWEFEDEAGQLDGTLAHAIERVVALSAKAAGYAIDDTATLGGLLSATGTVKPYPYARRSS